MTESQSVGGGNTTQPLTQRILGYTSRYGLEQATGVHAVWGNDVIANTDVRGAGFYKMVTNDRGRVFTFGTDGIAKAIFGGHRALSNRSGSRCAVWAYPHWNSGWDIGLRCACDHLAY